MDTRQEGAGSVRRGADASYSMVDGWEMRAGQDGYRAGGAGVGEGYAVRVWDGVRLCKGGRDGGGGGFVTQWAGGCA